MKKINFWIVLITGILVLIGSCATDDDSSSSSTSIPAAPTGGSATAGWHQVELDWDAVSGATSYTIYWDTSSGVSTSSTAITGVTDDNYTHTALKHKEETVASINSPQTLTQTVSLLSRGIYTTL
jgi:hypothetical protein